MEKTKLIKAAAYAMKAGEWLGKAEALEKDGSLAYAPMIKEYRRKSDIWMEKAARLMNELLGEEQCQKSRFPG